jgi:hypothetical protein
MPNGEMPGMRGKNGEGKFLSSSIDQRKKAEITRYLKEVEYAQKYQRNLRIQNIGQRWRYRKSP